MPRLNCFLFGTDWPAIAPDVVRTLLGPPNPDASSRKELRWGKRGSFALTLDSGRWRDYESGRSGGVLDLVERETGADRAGALEWLKFRGFLEIDRKGLHQRPIQPLSAGRTHETPPTTPQPPATATMRRRKALPGGWWDAAKPIPDDHAARRWMNRRNLWRMELPPWNFRHPPPSNGSTPDWNRLNASISTSKVSDTTFAPNCSSRRSKRPRLEPSLSSASNILFHLPAGLFDTGPKAQNGVGPESTCVRAKSWLFSLTTRGYAPP